MAVNDCSAQENGQSSEAEVPRSQQVENLLDAVKALIIPFIRSADAGGCKQKLSFNGHSDGPGALNKLNGLSLDSHLPERVNGNLKKPILRSRTTLAEQHSPHELVQLMDLHIPEVGLGREGFLEQVQQVLYYSINTWDPGFMSKLYSSTDAPGIAADLVLSTLNTQVHTYQVSPALTLVEKHTARALANLFGLHGRFAGGITTSGGSASNSTAMLVARHTLYPETKQHGNSVGGLRLAVFTSAIGHYSIEKAALTLGLGTSSVWKVKADPLTQQMDVASLRSGVQEAIAQGYTPFFLNATAGTTVFGSYDPLVELAAVCTEFNIWLHVDGSLGGPAIFSPTHRHKLEGCSLANSITVNPHKMMGVPTTCSFLLGPDTRLFHASNTLPASYLFHQDDAAAAAGEVFDLADLTMQCGRRGDSLKLYLSWIYHGTAGYAAQIDRVFETAAYLADLVSAHPDLLLVGPNPPPGCQVCFYYAPSGAVHADAAQNERVTRSVAAELVHRGFMIDFAGGDARGSFFRPAISRGTGGETVEELVKAIVELGREAWTETCS